MKLLIVGDKPSTKNLDPNVPFIGTHSYKRLVKWMCYLFVTDVNVEYVNSVSNEDLIKIKNFDGKIMALGYDASIRVKQVGKTPHEMPHPSPRNRQLNNVFYEYHQLNMCKRWLYDGKAV